MIDYPSPGQMLVDGLRQAIAVVLPNHEQVVDPTVLRLQPLVPVTPVTYSSAIALKLAKHSQNSALELAVALVSLLKSWQASHQQAKEPLLDLTIDATPEAWIEIQLSAGCLAAWLQQMTQSSPQRLSATPSPPRQNPAPEAALEATFALQYSHARCCSLVRLAHREGLLTLAAPSPPVTPLFWKVVAPSPLPWLSPEQRLWFSHPAEQQLLSDLLSFPQTLERSQSGNSGDRYLRQLWLQANHWSMIFQEFYRHCQIWGQPKRDSLSLCQARLGLILAIQPILRFYLEDLLGLDAPLEL